MQYKRVVKIILDIIMYLVFAMSSAFVSLAYYGKKLLQMKGKSDKNQKEKFKEAL